MEIKSYIEIQNLREQDVDLGIGIVRKKNDTAFEPGNIISITEKIDGSSSHIQYEESTNTLYAFSRRQPLDFHNTLDGFFNYVQALNPDDFKDCKDYAIFGEWLRKNKITYDKEKMKRWYVYSIYDKKHEIWLSQDKVKEIASAHNLEYIHELYYGPFISWEHCRTFLHSPFYGERQEGIVVRNITALEKGIGPHILKIVNEDFAEIMKQKVVDPEKEAEKAAARALMETIVTPRRVEKALEKLREDNILPAEIVPEDMGKVAKNLPKLVFNDCMKEEEEIVKRAGQYAGKMSSSICMQIARDILLG